jgi:hypothetical protein
VELGGERVCQEIEEELEKLEQAGQLMKKLSVVGYSLGGLVARYAVGLLYSRGVFDKLEPVVSRSRHSPWIRPLLMTGRTSRLLQHPISESELHCAVGIIMCGTSLEQGHFPCLVDSSL